MTKASKRNPGKRGEAKPARVHGAANARRLRDAVADADAGKLTEFDPTRQMAVRDENCANCRFSQPEHPQGEIDPIDRPGPLWCRRYAPRPMSRLADDDDGENTSTEWTWPTVWVENWCGEWAPVKPAKRGSK